MAAAASSSTAIRLGDRPRRCMSANAKARASDTLSTRAMAERSSWMLRGAGTPQTAFAPWTSSCWAVDGQEGSAARTQRE